MHKMQAIVFHGRASGRRYGCSGIQGQVTMANQQAGQSDLGVTNQLVKAFEACLICQWIPINSCESIKAPQLAISHRGR